jgi:hypothetical protein
VRSVAIHRGVDGRYAPEIAIPQEIGGIGGLAGRTALMAYLDDLFAVGAEPGGAHPLGVVYAESHRLFLIDMFAGAEGVDEVVGVKVLRSCDEHGVDAVVFKQQAMVVEHFAAGYTLQGAFAMGAVDIADGSDFSLGATYSLRGEVGSARAIADDAEPDTVVGSGHSAWNGESTQAGGDLTQELSSRTHAFIITTLRLTASMITADAVPERAKS